MVIQGYKAIPYHHTYAILTATPKSSIPDIDIELYLFDYKNGVSEVDIHVSNITTRTELVYPNAGICEVPPVRVEKFKTISSYITDVFSKININKSDISPEEFRKTDEFISKYSDVFSQGDAD